MPPGLPVIIDTCSFSDFGVGVDTIPEQALSDNVKPNAEVVIALMQINFLISCVIDIQLSSYFSLRYNAN